MDTLAITLVPYNQTFIIPKDWLLAALPNSILAQAVQLEPTISSLPITNSVVTPDVMTLLVDLSNGREPVNHNPYLLAVDTYLHIPEVLYYADPCDKPARVQVCHVITRPSRVMTDQIPNRQDGNAQENGKIIDKLIEEDRVWPYGYLIRKGYIPTNNDITFAAETGAINIVRLLMADPRIRVAGGNGEVLEWASEFGHPNIVALLLADPRVDPTADENSAIRTATEMGHLDVVKLLIADERVGPAGVDNESFRRAA